MLTVDDYAAIRTAHSRWHDHPADRPHFHVSLARSATPWPRPSPPPTPAPSRPGPRPRAGSRAIIDRILAATSDAPPKQRHTAAQLHRRLRMSTATPAAMPRSIATSLKHRRRYRATFIPLAHLPGHRLEADFGHIHVDFPDGRTPVPFLVAAWAYSNAPFVLALPIRAHRGRSSTAWSPPSSSSAACPGEVWWDNPRTVATLILQGRERQLHPRYAALASHHAFEPKFCMPARGNEKPDAESTVKAVQRRFATPVPRVADLDELNEHLRRRCLAERRPGRPVARRAVRHRDRLAEDLAAASPLARHRFDACVIQPAVAVDKYQSVAFDGNRYSVPRPCAFGMVTVKGYVDRVVVVAGGQVVADASAIATRSRQMILDPLHFLATLDRKPGGAGPRAGLPRLGAAGLLRRLPRRAGAQHGPPAGARQFARVLQLLGEHPLTRLSTADRGLRARATRHAEAMIQRTRALAAIEARRDTAIRIADRRIGVHVPLPT